MRVRKFLTWTAFIAVMGACVGILVAAGATLVQ